MPEEMKIPIEMGKENIVTVPKEIMKPVKWVQNICPKERDGTDSYSVMLKIMMVYLNRD